MGDRVATALTTPLKRISNPLGDVMHAMKRSDPGFSRFGEAYFTFVEPNKVKGWKRHNLVTLNVVVPIGRIRFVMHDGVVENGRIARTKDMVIGDDNYCRLTIPPGLWVAFSGLASPSNMLLNIIDQEHEPQEADSKKLHEFPFDW